MHGSVSLFHLLAEFLCITLLSPLFCLDDGLLIVYKLVLHLGHVLISLAHLSIVILWTAEFDTRLLESINACHGCSVGGRDTVLGERVRQGCGRK